MEKPKKENITRRLIFSFCLLIIIFLLFGIYSLHSNHTISGLARTIYNHPLVVSNAALQANVSITKIHRNMKDLVLLKSTDRIEQSIATVNQQEQLVYQYLDIVRDKILGEKGRSLEKESRTLFGDWRLIREEVIALVHNRQRDKAAEITVGKGADHVAKLEEKMFALTDYARTKASSFMSETEKVQSKLNVTTTIFLILSMTVSFMIAFFTLQQTASSEKELTESVQLLVNAIDYASIGMVLVEPGGNFFKTNQAFNKMIGYSEEELKQKTFQDITNPDDYDIGSKTVKQLIEGETDKSSFEKRYIGKNGNNINVLLTTSLLKNDKGKPQYFFTQIQDITERKQAEEQRDRLISDLQKTLSEVKTLRGFLPICSHCKKIRDDKGYWNQIEAYIHKHSETEFSHGICPECAKKMYPDMDLYDDNGEVTQD